MFQVFFDWALSVTAGLGYTGIGILMAIESSFLPFPSEVIIPPAAYLASRGEMNFWIIIIFGLIGSLIGAIFNYVLAKYLGKPLVYKLAGHRYAKFIMISPEKVERAEKYFFANADSATFIGRLIPVIRQLVSLPAGFSGMPFGRFIVLTALGSLIWVFILAILGYFIGSNQQLLMTYYREISLGLLLFGVLWFLGKRYQAKRKKKIIF